MVVRLIVSGHSQAQQNRDRTGGQEMLSDGADRILLCKNNVDIIDITSSKMTDGT